MRNSLIPLMSFAIAVALSMLTVSPRALARRAPQQATGCTAKATAKSATAKVTKFNVVVQDVQVQVDASDSSVLDVSAVFGLRGTLEVKFKDGTLASFGLLGETPLKPPTQTKNYTGAVSKLEKGFNPFGSPAGPVVAAIKKAAQQWKKDYPEKFNNVESETVEIRSGEVSIKGSYTCKSNGAGSFDPILRADVPIDKNGDGGGTVSQ